MQKHFTNALKYAKLFMNFKPLEELSLAISLPKGTKILKKYYRKIYV